MRDRVNAVNGRVNIVKGSIKVNRERGAEETTRGGRRVELVVVRRPHGDRLSLIEEAAPELR
jgi:microcompartment protein CcmL/EutN